MIEVKPTWPRPDESGQYVLRPHWGWVTVHLGIFLLLGIVAVFEMVNGRNALSQMAGCTGLVISGGLGITGLLIAIAGGFDLRLDGFGFTVARRHFAWVDVSRFTYGETGNGGKRVSGRVYFTVDGRPRSIRVRYGMTAVELTDFLNFHLARRTGRPLGPAASGGGAPPLSSWVVVFSFAIVLLVLFAHLY